MQQRWEAQISSSCKFYNILVSCNINSGYIYFFILLLLSSCNNKNESNLLFEILGPNETGIKFENNLKETLKMNGLFYEYFYNGGGLSVADFDNDGLQDVYFVSNLYPNRLYLNKGNLKFEDISKTSGAIITKGFPTGVTTVDINSDGWMDIYVSISGKYSDTRIRKNQLFVNQGLNENGDLFFIEQGAKYNLDIELCSTQGAFFDYDLDNDLDLFLINHYPDVYDFKYASELLKTMGGITGDRLYENQNGKYIEVTDAAGLSSSRLSYGLGIGISDLNNDGWPDVYVSNDFSGKDKLYMNNRNGTFTENIDKSIKHISYASMGNDLADFNNDGWSDIMTLDMMAEDHYTAKTSLGFMNDNKNFHSLVDIGLHHQYMYNTLQLNNGVLSPDDVPVFSDIAQFAGISSTDWSWAPLLFDMNNNGYKDLFIANGIKRDFINYDYLSFVEDNYRKIRESGELVEEELITNVLGGMPTRKKDNYFYKNNGDLSFEKMNGVWAENVLTSSNGSAYADFDNDGDLDIILNNSDAPAFIYKNNAIENGLGNYLQFKLKGPPKNPVGIGAKIIINQSDQIQVQEQYLSRGFQSSVSPILHFGLGTDNIVEEVKVIWPDRKIQIFSNIKANQLLNVNYQDAIKGQINVELPKPIFHDITSQLNLSQKHNENEYEDFERERLMPHKMSEIGPTISVADVNDDGLDDFFIGGAKGFEGRLLLQKNGSFYEPEINPWIVDKNSEDVGSCFFDADGDGDLELYVVSGGNEFDVDHSDLQDRLYLNEGSNYKKLIGALPNKLVSGSCIKPFDFDDDGDLDLFLGGRQIPGKYPHPASSYLLRNDSRNGMITFKDVTLEIAPKLQNIGMVTDAIWIDINNDQRAELIVVGEWMSIKVFENNDNIFRDITNLTGLSEDIGWWNCITSADFDQDGDMDLVVGNLGLNNRINGKAQNYFEIFSKDFDNNGKTDMVLGYHQDEQLLPFHDYKVLVKQLPFIGQKFSTFDAYANASLEDVMGEENLQSAIHYKATNFATCYVENIGDFTFKVRPLCNMAQISSVNGIIAKDVDNDGFMDITLAGNFYGFEVSIPRNDASIGLYLKGNGKGKFDPIPYYNSGLLINGDVRQIELINIGKDGRQGIIAAKNNDYVQLIEIVDHKK